MGLFAATPPLDTLKSMFALSFRENLKASVVEIQEAQLTGAVKPEGGNYAQALEERIARWICWTLAKWLYRLRLMSRAWEADCADRLGRWVCSAGRRHRLASSLMRLGPVRWSMATTLWSPARRRASTG